MNERPCSVMNVRDHALRGTVRVGTERFVTLSLCPRQAVREPHEWTKPGANDVSLRGGPWKLDAAPSYVVSSSPSSVMLLTLLSTSCSSLPYSQLLNRSQPSGFSSHSPSCQCRLCCDCFDTYLRSLCKCSGCICAGWGAPSLF